MDRDRLIKNLENLLIDAKRWDEEEYAIRDSKKKRVTIPSRRTIVASLIKFIKIL